MPYRLKDSEMVIFSRKKEILIGIILIGFVTLWLIFSGVFATSFDKNHQSENTTRVVSYNLNYLRTIFAPSEKQDAKTFDEFKEFMESLGEVEVFCVQETSSVSYRPIAEQLQYPHYFGHERTMIFSKMPFEEKGFVEYDHETNNSCTWATIKINNQPYRFYNIHLESNKFAQHWREFSDSMEILEKTDSLIHFWKEAAQLRVRQAQFILQHISESPYPVVVCGDFNEAPLSSIYSTFSEKLVDVFLKESFGFGQTYTRIPGLRIDYFFIPPQLKSSGYLRPKVDFSDHYPIIADLEL